MGEYFKSTEEFYDVMKRFLDAAMKDATVGPKLRSSGLIIQFVYTDPDAIITINLKDPCPAGAFGTYEVGPTDTKYDVQTMQAADFSNRFWQGHENPVTAIARRKMSARGNVPAMMKLVPVIRPTFRLYQQVLRDTGRTDLLVT